MLPNQKRQNHWLPNVFNDFFNDAWLPMRSSVITPAINVKENDNSYLIEIAVPGMKKEDCHVHVNDLDQLVVSVAKKQEGKEEDASGRYLRREFNYNRLEQVLQLPDYVNKEAITAKVCNGVLCVEVPKMENGTQKHPAKMIEIQ